MQVIRLGEPSRKVNLLGGVAQTLIYPRPSPSLTDVGLFVHTMLNNSPFKQRVIASFAPPRRNSGGGSHLVHLSVVSPVSQGSGVGPVHSWGSSTHSVQNLGHGFDTTHIRLGAPSQKVSLLGGIAQTLIYLRSSPSLTDVGLFVRAMLNSMHLIWICWYTLKFNKSR